MKVIVGKRELELNVRYVTELRDSNDFLGDVDKLGERIQEDGYLLIRGFNDNDAVLEARQEMLQWLASSWRLAPNTPVEHGIIGAGTEMW